MFGSSVWDNAEKSDGLVNALFGVTDKQNRKGSKKSSKKNKTADQIEKETQQAKEFLKTFKPKNSKYVRFNVSDDDDNAAASDDDDDNDISKRAKKTLKERKRKKRQKDLIKKSTVASRKTELDSEEEIFAEIDDEISGKGNKRLSVSSIQDNENKKEIKNEMKKSEKKIKKKQKMKDKLKQLDVPKDPEEIIPKDNPFTIINDISKKSKRKKKKLKSNDTSSGSSEEKSSELQNNSDKNKKTKSKSPSKEKVIIKNLGKKEILQSANLNEVKKVKKKKKKSKQKAFVSENEINMSVDSPDNSDHKKESLNLNCNQNGKTVDNENVSLISKKQKNKQSKNLPKVNNDGDAKSVSDSKPQKRKGIENVSEMSPSKKSKQQQSVHDNSKPFLTNNTNASKKVKKFDLSKLSRYLSPCNDDTERTPMVKKPKIEKPKETRAGKSDKSLKDRMRDQLNGARFRYINERLYTQTGPEAFEMFQSDNEAFKVYHDGFQSQVSKWPINPLDIIIKHIKQLPASDVIADFGCGDATLAQSVPNKVHSFDLVPLNDYVTVCDISKVPLPTKSVDVAVFCLSLMGTNLTDYVSEANRVLKPGGELKIAEVESRIAETNAFIIQIESFGFRFLNKDTKNKMFHLFDFTKVKPCMKSAVKDIKLEACIYKRR